MDNKKFSIEERGYFGISLLEVDEYANKLISAAVNSRQSKEIFTDAQTSYDSVRRVLSAEGVVTGATNESVALNGLVGCARAVRGLSKGNYPIAS